MQYQCTECNHHFDDQSAYCEDWSKPEKSFGCPHCKSFFYKNTRSSLKQSIALGILSGGVLLPALILTITSLVEGNKPFIFYGAAILLSGIGVISFYPKAKPELKTVESKSQCTTLQFAPAKQSETQQA